MRQIDYFHQRYPEKFGKPIKKICEPFFISNGITYFVYLKIRKDGGFAFLNTDQNYSGNYIEKIEEDPINLAEIKKSFFEKQKIQLINRKFEFQDILQKILKHYGLTLAESSCLSYFSQGLTAKEIAQVQKLSPRTIENHLQNIKNKLNIHSKSRLIRWYDELIIS